MKKLMTAVLMMTITGTAIAQEDFDVMVEQIVKLQIHIQKVKNGWEIAKDGLDKIGNWTNGEYKLHRDHFDSLVKVNPGIKNSQKVQASRQIYREILREFNLTIVRAQSSGMFAPQEIDYYNQVNERMIKDCRQLIESMTSMVTDGKLKMTDDERMENIDKYHQQMLANYTFTRNFCADIKSVQIARKKYKEDAEQVRKLFGLD